MTTVGDSAPTWLFIPGTLCDARVFNPLIAELKPAVADSVRVIERLDNATLGALADSSVQGMADRFFVVGFSLGCQVALEIMRKYADRCIGLILISTTARSDAPEMAAVRRGMVNEFAKIGARDFVEKNFWPVYFADQTTVRNEIKQLVQDMAARTPDTVFADQIELAIARPFSLPDLAHFTAPVLMITGAQDALTPIKMGAEIAAAASNGGQKIIPNAGHFVLLEQVRSTSDAIREWCK